ncbi:MAG: hypothetical protein SGI88_19665 [Candidatus Hydrogenedentes bacterium]|nr:hypothetical protein [Candidatus Hydrogenedentota bacterium]
MGAYVMLVVLVVLVAGLGWSLRQSYRTEHHEKFFGPAVLTFSAWMGVALAMIGALVFYLIMRNYGLINSF